MKKTLWLRRKMDYQHPKFVPNKMTDVKICWMMRNNLTLLNIDHLISNRSQGDDNSHVDEDWREYGRLFVKNPRGVRLRSRRVIDTSGEYETFNSI